MFFAHLPAGYLVSRCLIRGDQKTLFKWTLAAGMIGGIFPDVDLLYLYLLDATPQHHHTYWPHLPIAWLGIGLLMWIAARHREVAFRQALAAFLLGWLSHLLLDSLTGDIWWLYPLIDQPYSLAHVNALYQPWWINFLLHWSLALELAIITFAMWLEQKSPCLPWRIRLPKPLALFGISCVALILLEAYLPTPALRQPVLGATAHDWNPKSFWHPHWGASGIHKGIDIFAKRGTPVVAAQPGLVLYRDTVKQGGKIVLVASPRGWLHYYAHLDSALAASGSWVSAGETLGAVGATGNARGKPAHLHYAIFSPIPRLQAFRPVAQGWKRVFYRDPGSLMEKIVYHLA